MKQISFDPLDTLFFRDSRPYNQGDSPQDDVHSLFPPSPTSLVGATRAAYARAMGWANANNGWSNEIKSVLGDGEELRDLRFIGPLVLQGDKPLFPAPAHLQGTVRTEGEKSVNKLNEVTCLTSDSCEPDSRYCSDLGQSVMLTISERSESGSKVKTLLEEGWWLKCEGLKKVLEGNIPSSDDFVHQDELWKKEYRVGLVRDATKRTTEENALYSPAHIRLKKGISLALLAEGLPKEYDSKVQQRPQPLGGESRFCWLDVKEGETFLSDIKMDIVPSESKLRYTITFLTPGDAKRPPLPGDKGYLGLPGQVISACLPRPQLWGGWSKGTPLPLCPHLAPGSVLFMEADQSEQESIASLHATNLGERGEWGFGLVAVGRWPEQQPTPSPVA